MKYSLYFVAITLFLLYTCTNEKPSDKNVTTKTLPFLSFQSLISPINTTGVVGYSHWKTRGYKQYSKEEIKRFKLLEKVIHKDSVSSPKYKLPSLKQLSTLVSKKDMQKTLDDLGYIYYKDDLFGKPRFYFGKGLLSLPGRSGGRASLLGMGKKMIPYNYLYRIAFYDDRFPTKVMISGKKSEIDQKEKEIKENGVLVEPISFFKSRSYKNVYEYLGIYWQLPGLNIIPKEYLVEEGFFYTPELGVKTPEMKKQFKWVLKYKPWKQLGWNPNQIEAQTAKIDHSNVVCSLINHEEKSILQIGMINFEALRKDKQGTNNLMKSWTVYGDRRTSKKYRDFLNDESNYILKTEEFDKFNHKKTLYTIYNWNKSKTYAVYVSILSESTDNKKELLDKLIRISKEVKPR